MRIGGRSRCIDINIDHHRRMYTPSPYYSCISTRYDGFGDYDCLRRIDEIAALKGSGGLWWFG